MEPIPLEVEYPEVAEMLLQFLARGRQPRWHLRADPAFLPNRNEPCFCGSGKKFKKCCNPTN